MPNYKYTLEKQYSIYKEFTSLDTSSQIKKMEKNLKKIKIIFKWLTSILAKRILLFLEFAEFYQKFIKSYLEIITPFTEMTRKNIVFT